MPWHNPAVLTEKGSIAVTVLESNFHRIQKEVLEAYEKGIILREGIDDTEGLTTQGLLQIRGPVSNTISLIDRALHVGDGGNTLAVRNSRLLGSPNQSQKSSVGCRVSLGYFRFPRASTVTGPLMNRVIKLPSSEDWVLDRSIAKKWKAFLKGWMGRCTLLMIVIPLL